MTLLNILELPVGEKMAHIAHSRLLREQRMERKRVRERREGGADIGGGREGERGGGREGADEGEGGREGEGS